MNAIKINDVKVLLKGLIHNSLISSVKFVVDKCTSLGNTPQEPDFIASLTLKFTPELFNNLKAVFPNNKFSVTGVFCHQKPLADIGSEKDPEIGDLLFVYIYTDNDGKKKFNSILFQAKISNKSSLTVSSTDTHQLKLYSEWPTFSYKRAGVLNGKERDILPKTINDGAQYLLIDNHPIYGLAGVAGTFPMGCAIPSSTLNLNNDLAEEIIDFLKFKSGRTFEENPSLTKDDWTKMIWDLLTVTKDKASKRKNAGIGGFPRRVSEDFDGCCFFMSESNSIFDELHKKIKNSGLEHNLDKKFEDENSSLSVILIESSELIERQKRG